LYSTKYYRDQNEDEVSQIWRVEKCAQNLFINMKGDHFEDLYIDGRIILKWNVKL
jgi:hypothetical protein